MGPHLYIGLSDSFERRRESLAELLLVLPLLGAVGQDSVPPPDTRHKGLVSGDVQAKVLDHLLNIVERLLRRRVVAPPPHDEGRLSPPEVSVRRAGRPGGLQHVHLALQCLQPGVHRVLLPLSGFHCALLFLLLVVDCRQALQCFLQLRRHPRLNTVHALADLRTEGCCAPPHFTAHHFSDGLQAELFVFRRPPLLGLRRAGGLG